MKTEAMEFLKDVEGLKELWVFGYGSLMWNPGFKYTSSKVGYINGYTRKFWQGNTTHRGTPNKPGRVATLIEDKNNKVWGRVFHLLTSSQILPCLDHLGLRECTLGGYDIQLLPFYDRDSDEAPVLALTFIATPLNCWYMGPASTEQMASEIVGCRGVCGTNAEYVLRIADFMRKEMNSEMEEELRHLEKLIIFELERSGQLDPNQLDDSELDICGPMLDLVFRAVESERIVKGQAPFQSHAKDSVAKVPVAKEIVNSVTVGFAKMNVKSGSNEAVALFAGKDTSARDVVVAVKRKNSEG